MEYLEAIILGVVQGLTEFLPVSSSGHLVISSAVIERFTGVPHDPEQNLVMIVALHLGTLGSIFVYFFRDILQLRTHPKTVLGIVVATLPLLAVALVPIDGKGETLKDLFELTNTPLRAGYGLLVTTVLLILGHSLMRERDELRAVDIRQAGIVGLFQTIALAAGVSRSGSTIVGGLVTGMRRETATTFSFLIAIPAILGAAVLKAKDAYEQPELQISYLPILLGMAIAFVTGLVALKILVGMISRQKLHWFAWYCGALAVLTIGWQLLVPR